VLLPVKLNSTIELAHGILRVPAAGPLLAIVGDAVGLGGAGAFRGDGVVHEAEARVFVEVVLIFEELDDFLGEQFAAEGVGFDLDDFGKGDLEAAREVELEALLDDPGDAAFAALGVDADDGFVGAADVLGVEGEVGDLPGVGVGEALGFADLEAFFDGVLVGSAEGALDEGAAVWSSGVDWDVVAFFDDADDGVYVGEVDARMYPLGVQI